VPDHVHPGLLADFDIHRSAPLPRRQPRAAGNPVDNQGMAGAHPDFALNPDRPPIFRSGIVDTVIALPLGWETWP